jgi:L-serine dehydratase
MLGPLGEEPDRVDPDSVPVLVAGLRSIGAVQLRSGRAVAFNPDVDLVFRRRETLPFHPNAIRIAWLHDVNVVLERTYYSVGGGFVVEEGEAAATGFGPAVPRGITTAAEMLAEGAGTKPTVAELQRSNERTRRNDKDISAGIYTIWTAMRDCVQCKPAAWR